MPLIFILFIIVIFICLVGVLSKKEDINIKMFFQGVITAPYLTVLFVFGIISAFTFGMRVTEKKILEIDNRLRGWVVYFFSILCYCLLFYYYFYEKFIFVVN